jgi:HK97 family phage portal protein
MSQLRRAFREIRSVSPWDPSALGIPAPGHGGSFSSAGTMVNDRSALGIITMFAGVRIIADSVSTTPLRAVTQAADGTRQPVKDSPPQLIEPFMGISLLEGLSQLVSSLILRGNAYAYVVARDPRTFKPLQVRILHPDQVGVSWSAFGYRDYKIGGQLVDHDNMVHLTSFMLPNSLVGASLIEYCRNALGLGIALDEVAGSFFENGVMSTGVIGVDAPLTPDQARATAEMFQSLHTGVKRANMPIVMSGGAKYTPLSLTPEDAQFIESRQFEAGQIATLIGVPPHLLGMVDRTTSWGTGIEVQGRAFVDYTLRPYYVRLQNMFTSWLPDGMFADFITDAITRADTQTRYGNYSKALMDGWLNVDAVRLQEGLPPLPDGAGQVYRVAANQIPVANSDGDVAAAAPTALPANDPSTGATDASN